MSYVTLPEEGVSRELVSVSSQEMHCLLDKLQCLERIDQQDLCT